MKNVLYCCYTAIANLKTGFGVQIMTPLNVTFDLPAKIATGLAHETLIRNGGVIQDTSGRVVMWLRELGTAGALSGSNPLMMPSIDPVTGVLNLAMQGVNAGISMRGFAALQTVDVFTPKFDGKDRFIETNSNLSVERSST
jgi:hypothetical protein